ncbi:MAG TPA: YeeE/YedE family protein [Castellaniella sp.]|uniref:YeeE/YedE family protein n=1 Tax=Castellaniella sp. TaxID=1955812 RepID=UPI002F114589
MGIVTSLLVGVAFGVGLILSGMVLPAKVLGFLDITGAWDPSLGLVMIGAVLTGIGAFTVARHRQRSLLGFEMKLPTAHNIDRRLVLGSLIFGVGWGIAGLCPGPAIVNLGTGQAKAIVFFVALVAGMGLFEFIERHKHQRYSTTARNDDARDNIQNIA